MRYGGASIVRERIKTFVLVVLVLLSVGQFSLMIVAKPEQVRVLSLHPSKTDQGYQEELEDLPPDVLAVPLSMVVHLENQQHRLLRSSSKYFGNIWNYATSSLTTLPSVDAADFAEVDRANWDTDKLSIELVLMQALPLDIYLDMLGIECRGDAFPRVDRFYFSTDEENAIYLSDGSAHIYRTPWASQPEILDSFLNYIQNGIYLSVVPYDLGELSLASFHDIYIHERPGTASSWIVQYELNGQHFREVATQFFSESPFLRALSDENSEITSYENLEQRLRYDRYSVLFESWNISYPHVSEGEEAKKQERESVRFLRSLELWPDDSLYSDGRTSDRRLSYVYFQYAKNGMPVLRAERDEATEQLSIKATFKAEFNNGEIGSFDYQPIKLVNSRQDNMPVISQQQVLRSFAEQEEDRREEERASICLRAVYEGFLCIDNDSVAQPVWIIEFVDGRRYFYDISSGAYLGYQQAVTERY